MTRPSGSHDVLSMARQPQILTKVHGRRASQSRKVIPVRGRLLPPSPRSPRLMGFNSVPIGTKYLPTRSQRMRLVSLLDRYMTRKASRMSNHPSGADIFVFLWGPAFEPINTGHSRSSLAFGPLSCRSLMLQTSCGLHSTSLKMKTIFAAYIRMA